MGADWLCLFDKRLCDEIISLASDKLPAFAESTHELREQGRTDEELKADLVDDLCVFSDRLTVDYWGCYAEVFSSKDPPGSIPDYLLFPHIKQQGYLLLLPEHVDRMLASLEEHRGEMRVMQEPQLAQLRQWRMRCGEDPGCMVAYFFDA